MTNEENEYLDIKWGISEDKKKLTIIKAMSEGYIEVSISWTFTPTVELIQKTLNEVSKIISL